MLFVYIMYQTEGAIYIPGMHIWTRVVCLKHPMHIRQTMSGLMHGKLKMLYVA